MKANEYWSSLFRASQDPTVIAYAEADFYRAIATRTAEKVESLSVFADGGEVDTSVLDSPIFVSNLSIFDENGDELDIISTGFTMSDNPILQGILNNDSYIDDKGDFIDNVPIKTIDGSILYVDMDDLIDRCGFTADQNEVIAMAYEAIRDNTISNLYSKLNVVYKEVSSELSTVISAIADPITNGSLTVLQKLETMAKFTSTNIIEQMTGGVTSEDIIQGNYDGAIQKFTGANPVMTLLSGLSEGIWLAGQSLADNVQNVVVWMCTYGPYRLFAEINGRILGFIGSKVFGFLKTTFVDPVDYIATGDAIQYFKNTSQSGLHLAKDGAVYSYVSRVLEVGQQAYFSVGPIIYRFTRLADTSIVCEQWVKPIDPNAAAKAVRDINITSLSQMTYRQLSALLGKLNQADPLPNKSSEKQVMHGIQISTIIGDLLNLMMVNSAYLYAFENAAVAEVELDVPITESISRNIDVILGPDGLQWASFNRNNGTVSVNELGGVARLDFTAQMERFFLITNLYRPSTESSNFTALVTSNRNVTSRGSGIQSATAAVNNSSLVYAVTLDFLGYANGVFASQVQTSYGQYEAGIWFYNTEIGSSGTLLHSTKGVNLPFMPLLLFMPVAYRKNTIGTASQQNALLYVGYSLDAVPFTANAEIKSDAANATALVATIVAALVITAAVVVAKNIPKIRVARCKKSFRLNQATLKAKKKFVGLMNLPTASEAQRDAAASAYLKAMRKENRFLKWKGNYGFTSALGKANVSAAGVNISEFNTKEITSLIK